MKNIFLKLINIIDDIIYYIILIPLAIISLILVYKSIKYPEKIPDVFGYKMFIILDNNTINSIEYGDLIFTKNTDVEFLNSGDVVAVRNNDIVTIYRVSGINEKQITISNDYNVSIDNVEGKIINKVAKIGIILYFIQQPLILITIILIILIIGLIIYYIAQQLDYRDMKKIEELDSKKQEQQEIKQKEKAIK